MRRAFVLLVVALALSLAFLSADVGAASGAFGLLRNVGDFPTTATQPVVTAAPIAEGPPTELVDYVTAPDASYSWSLNNKVETDLGIAYTIDLVSQTWHDIKWDHKLQVYLPKNVKPQATMVVWNQGGTPDALSALIGLQLAAKVNAPVAFLYGVPKQPLFGGKTEDALIAETFVQYLETGDGTWPLLFPMVKSIVRGMDALQAFARKEWKFEVKDFIITGASKRGWTTWLTAAVGDKRVKAIAPLVIDTLNIPVQMKNQIVAFGKPSDMIKDYVARKLIPIPNTPAAQRLWVIIDPWTYRDKITVPKLIVNGTNDPYWPLDALNTYWDGLKGDKWLLYVPNAPHELVERDKDGKSERLPMRTINTVSAFCRCQIFNKPLPKISTTFLEPPLANFLDLSVTCSAKPMAAKLLTASAATRDFRQAWWEPEPLTLKGDSAVCKVDLPKKGHSAALVELEFELEGLKYCLSTPLRILDAKK